MELKVNWRISPPLNAVYSAMVQTLANIYFAIVNDFFLCLCIYRLLERMIMMSPSLPSFESILLALLHSKILNNIKQS